MAQQRTAKVADGTKVALVLQGGGALGAYHIGAYAAMAEQGFEPDWIAGISIGAINACVLAGNEPDQRLARLEALWEAISWPEVSFPTAGPVLKLENQLSSLTAFTLGQPNFFQPRFPPPTLALPGTPGATSYYDTSPLRDTLLRLADFERIAARRTRLSLGATHVLTGALTFFDNTRDRIGPEHVMASGSLPPGFPATMVDGEPYWDGGCVSNTPLDAIVDDTTADHLLVFMIDLWAAQGKLPQTMDDVTWRSKQIQYASRTSAHVEACVKLQNARRMLAAKAAVPAAGTDVAAVDSGEALLGPRELDIVHIIYAPDATEVPTSDAEFSRHSISQRRAAGYHDMLTAIRASPWLQRSKPAGRTAAAHIVRHGQLEATHSPGPGQIASAAVTVGTAPRAAAA